MLCCGSAPAIAAAAPPLSRCVYIDLLQQAGPGHLHRVRGGRQPAIRFELLELRLELLQDVHGELGLEVAPGPVGRS